MALRTNKLAAATAVAAVFSMLATPAMAADLPRAKAVSAYDGDAGNAAKHRRWRRDRDRVDTGDVLTGILILGGIAAIASAASNDRKRDRDEDRYPPPRDEARFDNRYESRGLERAVDMCVAAVEQRSERVGGVDSASRTGDGWHVAGELAGGAPYSCWIGNNGEVSNVEIGGTSEAGYEASDAEQWRDEDYARARAARNAPEAEGYEGDGRYETARAPDFE